MLKEYSHAANESRIPLRINWLISKRASWSEGTLIMASKNSAALRLISLLLVLAIAQVYVLANPGTSLFGRLTTSGDSIITVNSLEARSGATILSGAELQTPENIAAIVQLGSLGKLEIAPNTKLTLDFDEGQVNVNVLTGEALLTANKGVNGAVTFNGKVERTDPLKDSSVASASPDPGWGYKHHKALWWWLGAAGATIFLIWLIQEIRENNPSPMRP